MATGRISQIPLLNDIPPEDENEKAHGSRRSGKKPTVDAHADLLKYDETAIEGLASTEPTKYQLAEWFYHDGAEGHAIGEKGAPVPVPCAPDWIQHDDGPGGGPDGVSPSVAAKGPPVLYPMRPPFSIDTDLSGKDLNSRKWRAWKARQNPKVPEYSLPPIIQPGQGPDGNFSALMAHQYQKEWIEQQNDNEVQLRAAKRAAALKKKKQKEARDPVAYAQHHPRHQAQQGEPKPPFRLKKFDKVQAKTNTYRGNQ